MLSKSRSKVRKCSLFLLTILLTILSVASTLVHGQENDLRRRGLPFRSALAFERLAKQKDSWDRSSRIEGRSRSIHRHTDLKAINGQTTIPTWGDSFTYQGLEFSYRMVGTDPKKGSRTTTIPTEIIPLRFVFADGTVFDASTDHVDGVTPVTGVVNSPIFKNHDYVIGGTDVGNTQYGDAFQRANFWDSVSVRARNYHVLLGQPTIFPVQTIIVPADKGFTFVDPNEGTIRYGDIDPFFLDDQFSALFDILNIRTDSLPILLADKVAYGGGVGVHDQVQRQSGLQTWIYSVYDPQDSYIAIPDASVLSHEIGEWMDDPFVNNYTAGWSFVTNQTPQCAFSEYGDNVLEVADPFEFTPGEIFTIPIGTTQYHVVNLAFVDYFTRNSHSRSVNGQYYFFGQGTPSTDCTGIVSLKTEQLIDVPGSKMTETLGINNQGDVVGYYRDQSGVPHGFLLSDGRFSSIQPPGSLRTIPYSISESGQIYGYFRDTTGWHGFIYKDRVYKTLNFPGASQTFVFGGNNEGVAIGSYLDAQSNEHGFEFRDGNYSSIDNPFGHETRLYFLNEPGDYCGYAYGNPLGDLEYGFIHNRAGYERQDVPGSLNTEVHSFNTSGTVGGEFWNADGAFSGFVTIFGHYHLLAQDFDGMNDHNQIVGLDYDPDQNKLVGFVGTLPIAEGEDHNGD